jgi:serine/threonine-protein kinase HipA
MAGETTEIAVYADWLGLTGPLKLGMLRAHWNGGREVFEFTFEESVLGHPHLRELQLDPRLGVYAGPQYATHGAQNFGLFLDSSPDRWGRILMRRRFERARRAAIAGAKTQLSESDYLLGVHDTNRLGALRFRLNDEGPFLDDSPANAAPPLVQLRTLEHASRVIDSDRDDDRIDEWLKLLVAPGGSLGGARPKASVVDLAGALWIAKFPKESDTHDVAAWEIVVSTLARGCGIDVPPARIDRFGSNHNTFLIRRFDRTPEGGRLHFASALTMTGRNDGADAASGASYLDIAEVLVRHGARTDLDLPQLWRRIVFNMCVSNTDDHLRNHGFILEPGAGWRLAPAYDMNPVAYGDSLTLNVSERDNAKDLALAVEVAPLYRIEPNETAGIIESMRATVQRWPELARRVGLSQTAQDRMAPAFALAG